MFVDKDGSPLGELSERLTRLPVREAQLEELKGLVGEVAKFEGQLARLLAVAREARVYLDTCGDDEGVALEAALAVEDLYGCACSLGGSLRL